MQLSPCLAEAECSEFRLMRSRLPTKSGVNPAEKIQVFLLKNRMKHKTVFFGQTKADIRRRANIAFRKRGE